MKQQQISKIVKQKVNRIKSKKKLKLKNISDKQKLLPIEELHLKPNKLTQKENNKNGTNKVNNEQRYLNNESRSLEVLQMLKEVKDRKAKVVNAKLKNGLRKIKKRNKNKNNSMIEGLIELNKSETLADKKRNKFYGKLRQTLEEMNVKKPVTSLRTKMMEKLKAARFRFLNEQIYKTNSKETQKIFKTDPDAFKAYHEGYRHQVKSWPVNPVNVIIKSIKKMPSWYTIADLGCGDAQIAKSVEQQVYSFDLVAANESVIECDMANIPLENDNVNTVVFCLSLMGTNLNDYILEANRILKMGGVLKIADVESRFENVDDFIKKIQKFGFRNVWKDLSYNLFYFLDFIKVHNIKNKNKLPTLSLLPCLYKKR